MSAIADFDRYDWALLVATCTAMMAVILLWAALWIAVLILLIGLIAIVLRNMRKYLHQHGAVSEADTPSTVR